MCNCEFTETDIMDMEERYRSRIQDACRLAKDLRTEVYKIHARIVELEDAIFHIERH